MKTTDYNEFAGKICKVEYKDFLGIKSTCVAMVHKDMFGFTLGHPMIGSLISSGANHSIRLADITSIRPASNKDVKMWVKRYKQFHADVIAEHGYDACEENLAAYELADLGNYVSKIDKRFLKMKEELLFSLKDLLKTYGFVSYAKPLALTMNVDGAYAPTLYEDEVGITYARIERVVLTELGDLVYATKWDLNNTLAVEDAYQLVEEEMNPYDIYELLSSCKQQIERNLENSK